MEASEEHNLMPLRRESRRESRRDSGPRAVHWGHSYRPTRRAIRTGAIAIARPTFLKVDKKHLDPETLNAYGIYWEWDEVS